jgi:hypothetical protein
MKRPQRDHLEKSQIEGFDDEANKERAFRPQSQGPMDCPFFMTDRAWALDAQLLVERKEQDAHPATSDD